jgi:hypothetical protein
MKRGLALLFFLIASVGVFAFAETWEYNGVYCGGLNEQSFDHWSASHSAGGVTYAWIDNAEGLYNIRWRRYAYCDTPNWTDPVNVTNSEDFKSCLFVQSLAGGCSILVWRFRDQNGEGIKAQKVDSTGVSLWAHDGVTVYAKPDSCESFDLVGVVPSFSSAFIILRTCATGCSPAFNAYKLTSQGGLAWSPESRRLFTGSWYVSETDGLYSSDGLGGLAAINLFDSGDGCSLHLVRVHSDGTFLGPPEGIAMDDSLHAAWRPRVMKYAEGAVVVTWTSMNPQDGWRTRLLLQIQESDGTKRFPLPIQLSFADFVDHWVSFGMDVNKLGIVFVACSDEHTGDRIVQAVSPDGGLLWGQEGVSLPVGCGEDEYIPRVCAFGDQACFVLNEHDPAQFYSSRLSFINQGEMIWSQILGIHDGYSDGHPRLFHSEIGCNAVWEQDMQCQREIWSQKFSADGQTHFPNRGIRAGYVPHWGDKPLTAFSGGYVYILQNRYGWMHMQILDPEGRKRLDPREIQGEFFSHSSSNTPYLQQYVLGDGLGNLNYIFAKYDTLRVIQYGPDGTPNWRTPNLQPSFQYVYGVSSANHDHELYVYWLTEDGLMLQRVQNGEPLLPEPHLVIPGELMNTETGLIAVEDYILVVNHGHFLRAMRVNPDGTQAWASNGVLPGGVGDTACLGFPFADDAGLTVVWAKNATSDHSILYRQYTPDGVALEDSARVLATETSTIYNLRVVRDDGGYTILYSQKPGACQYLTMTRYNRDMEQLWSLPHLAPDMIDLLDTDYIYNISRSNPTLTVLQSGILATWNTVDESLGQNICALFVAFNGQIADGPRILCDHPFAQIPEQVFAAGENRAVVVWRDDFAMASPPVSYSPEITPLWAQKIDYSANVSAEEVPPSPATLFLAAPYPNPFNPLVNLDYSLPTAGKVRLDIFNVRGERIRRLVDETIPAGSHRIQWNGDDDHGVRMGAGVYFVRMRQGASIITRKVLMLK